MSASYAAATPPLIFIAIISPAPRLPRFHCAAAAMP